MRAAPWVPAPSSSIRKATAMSDESTKPQNQSDSSSDNVESLFPGDGLVSDDGTIPTGDDQDPRDARIAELEEQLGQLKDQAMRALADAENTRRRAQQEVEKTKKYGAQSLARDLFTALDNLGRALHSVPDREGLDELAKNLVVGVEMTEKEILSAFEKNGIKRIEPLGEKFDPNFHEAMFEVPNTDKPTGTVVQVMAPGFVLHDRLLRAAMVGVAKGGPAPQDHKSVDTTA